MDVVIVATKACSQCSNMSNELHDIGTEHRIAYAEEDPDLCEKLSIRHSPNLVVHGDVVFRCQPSEQELHKFFQLKEY